MEAGESVLSRPPPRQEHLASVQKVCNFLVQLGKTSADFAREGRVAKCHGYDGLIRVKILASWSKGLGEHTILQNEAFFGTDLHNLYEISLSKFYTLTESSTSVLQKYPYCKFW